MTRFAKDAYTKNSELALLVVDGLRRFKPIISSAGHLYEDASIAYDQQSACLEAALCELKALAVQLNVPIVMTWQLGPEVDQRTSKRPTMADLHLTEVMEDAIDSVMLLFNEDSCRLDDAWNGITDLFIVRNRHGVTGMVRLAREAQYARFQTLAMSFV